MKELVFLCHRIPYPLNRGDRIRSFDILRYLAARYVVHRAACVDEPEDWQHAGTLRELCAGVTLMGLPRCCAWLRSAIGFLTPSRRDCRCIASDSCKRGASWTQRADAPRDFVHAVTQLPLGEPKLDGRAGRHYPSERCGWQARLPRRDRWFTSISAGAP